MLGKTISHYEIVHEEPEPLASYDRALPAAAQLVMARALAKCAESGLPLEYLT